MNRLTRFSRVARGACAAAAAAFFSVGGAEASVLTYDINANYPDGSSVNGTITGSFTVDYLVEARPP